MKKSRLFGMLVTGIVSFICGYLWQISIFAIKQNGITVATGALLTGAIICVLLVSLFSRLTNDVWEISTQLMYVYLGSIVCAVAGYTLLSIPDSLLNDVTFGGIAIGFWFIDFFLAGLVALTDLLREQKLLVQMKHRPYGCTDSSQDESNNARKRGSLGKVQTGPGSGEVESI